MSAQSVLFDLPGPKAIARHRIYTVVAALVIVAVAFGMLWALRESITPDKWAPFADPVTWTAYILPGFGATIVAAVGAVILAGIIGVVLGMGRLSHSKPIASASGVFVEFFRSVPVLMMMIFAFYAFVYGRILTGAAASLAGVIVGLTLYNSCVIAELVRSGVHALPKGQTEAGLAIGLTPQQTLRIVLLPQAIRAMLPALISQLIVVLKDTALGYIIVYPELLQSAERLAAGKGNLIAAYIVVAVIYILINGALSYVTQYVERWVGGRQAAGHVLVNVTEELPLVPGLKPVEPSEDR